MTPSLHLPAHALLDLLRAREVTAIALLEATLERIARVNPALNAVVTLDVEGARAAAQASDRRLAAGEGGALEGLPVTVKDTFDVAGVRSTAGSDRYRDRIPEADAAAVARLRRAGAVIVGKTNVPPLASDLQTTNELFGTTSNPYDLARSSGGSSGGAAAAVAAGLAALELGSDIGGSIRWPAQACGLFGHKPSWGLVSLRGHVPPPPGIQAESDLAAAGPLARSAADLALALDAIQGPAALDGVPARLDPPRRAAPTGLRVAVWSDDPFAPVDAEARRAVETAAERLAGAGAVLDAAARPDVPFAAMFETFALLYHALVAAGRPPETRDRLVALAGTLPAEDRSHRALQARAARLGVETYRRLQAERAAIREAWERFFDRFDALLCPPAPVAAIPHDRSPGSLDRTIAVNGAPRPYLDLMIWPSLATLAGLPATVVPVARTAGGLPVGVQVVGPAGGDRTTLAVAAMLEGLGCRFVPPP